MYISDNLQGLLCHTSKQTNKYLKPYNRTQINDYGIVTWNHKTEKENGKRFPQKNNPTHQKPKRFAAHELYIAT